MKKILLPIFLFATTFATAQLNDRFWSGGYAPLVSAIGAYGSNTFIQWRDVQQYPNSSYNWTLIDAPVQANQSAGLHTMFTLKCVHPINSNDSTSGTCAYILDQQSTDNGSNWPVTGADTTKWKNFVNALVDRYDGDGNNDMPGLIYPITQWHIIGQEWQRVWCDVPNADTAFQSAKDFVKLVNMTYNVIKTRQPNSTVSYAGIDTRNQDETFYDGYFPISQTTICKGNCSSSNNFTQAQLASLFPNFLPNRRNVIYIFKNALSDEVDLHEYGRWQNIPDFARWAKDSTFGKPVIFMEGGGPFCKACENLYHNASDTDGKLPAALVRDNASYVVYYFITGLASGVKKLHWHLGQEYSAWGAWWGDLDLLSINNVKKPSLYVYRFLAQTIFSNANADTVVKITETNPALYHYQINPLTLNVVWSTNTTDSIIVSGSGQLYLWNIPTTCDSLYPTYCDSLIQQSSVNVSGSYTINLNNGVPVFYSWNNVFASSEYISSADNYSIKFFPNPFSLQTTLQVNKNLSNATLTVYNCFGQTVEQIKNINGQTVVLSRDNLASGLYFVQLSQDNQTIATKKLIITD